MGHVNHLFGYGPGFSMSHHSIANHSNTPCAHSNNEDGSEGHDGGQPKPISGMNLLIFVPAGMPANNHMVVRASVGHDGNYHPAVLQVVSPDSQTENGGATT